MAINLLYEPTRDTWWAHYDGVWQVVPKEKRADVHRAIVNGQANVVGSYGFNANVTPTLYSSTPSSNLNESRLGEPSSQILPSPANNRDVSYSVLPYPQPRYRTDSLSRTTSTISSDRTNVSVLPTMPERRSVGMTDTMKVFSAARGGKIPPPPGIGEEINAIVGEGGDARAGGTGLELVIIPRRDEPGSYTVHWTDTPLATHLQDGTVVIPVEETTQAVRAIKEQFPKLVGEELLKRGGVFVPKTKSASIPPRIRAYERGGMTPGSPTPSPPTSSWPPSSLPPPPPRLSEPTSPWWQLTRQIRTATGELIDPYIGLTVYGAGNLSQWLMNDPVVRERIGQDAIQRGWLGGADFIENQLRQSAPGVRSIKTWVG